MVRLYSKEFITGPSVLQKDNVLIGQNSFSSENQTFGENTKKEREYIVQKGDSLSVIAEKFGVSVSTIVWENDLSKNIIKVGQKLNVLPVNGINHTIKSGDTLSAIVKKYKGDLDLTRDFNFLTSNNEILNVGDRILVVGVRGLKLQKPCQKPHLLLHIPLTRQLGTLVIQHLVPLELKVFTTVRQ
jgi:LysM repeat protein